jgi:Zn-dependent M28 family amino/carboxypeptidase
VKKPLSGLVAVMAAILVLAPAASAIDTVDTKKLRNRVTVDGILEHLRAFQEIAIAHDGNRAAATPGYDASVDYVVNRMKAAGYKVTLNEFDFPLWTLNQPSTVDWVGNDTDNWVEETDFVTAQYSSSADLTATVVPTNDIQVPPPGGPGTGTSGCDPGDFPPNTAGNIALMQRGFCPFTQKYDNAKAAGAVAALIFNDGGEGREEPLLTTASPNIGIPTLMLSNDAGEALLNAAGAQLHIVVDATTSPNTEVNVIADSRFGKKGRTIVVGGHLDSVPEGPGINDNGSGTGSIIEVAEQVAKLKQRPRNRLRFAFWGAEESGLVGSTAYVNQQADAGTLDQIEANLNFDMVGSPNFVRFVYDGDLSDSPPPPSGAPNGSGQIEHMFQRYFSSQGLVTDPTAFDGRSDYGEFIAQGVPAGGLFSGAEGIKTERQESIYGGFAGLAFDPCYHQACDTFFNLSETALDQFSDAIAHGTWTLARSKSPVTQAQAAKAKGKKSKKRGKSWKFQGPFRVR